jgi:hypothetical protein
MDNFFRIANWKRFQHYGKRNPPWIKLYRELLTSRAWISGDDANRALMVALMLIAADTDNLIPADPTYVQRRAYLNSEPNFSRLLEVGFLEHASNVLATCKQDARPETEAEAEIESEKNPPFKESVLFHSKEKSFSQTDFDEEAYRLFAKAGRELELKFANGLQMCPDEAFKYQCAKAGKSPQRMTEILARVEGASA